MGTGIKGLFRRGNSWVIDKQIHGQRICRSLGNIPRKEAEKICIAKSSEILNGKRLSRGSLTVHDVLSTFWFYKLKEMASAKTAPYYLSMVDDFLGAVRLCDLALTHILNYTRERLSTISRYNRPLSFRTVEAGLDLLNCAINFGIRNRDIPFHPAPYWKKEIRSLYAPQEPKEYVILDGGMEEGPQWRALLNAAHASLRPVLTLLYETGMRKGEILKLRWTWIDLFACVINLPGIFEGHPVTKSRKGRTIPLSASSIDLLASLDKETEWVFHRGTYPWKTFDKGFRAARRRAGIDERFTIHCLRKQRATIWNRIDEYAAMRALGHSDQKTHRNHYASVTVERLRGLVNSGSCVNFAGLQGHKAV